MISSSENVAMIKNIALGLSLLANLVVAYFVFGPRTTSPVKMTCAEARSEDLSKSATSAFAQAHAYSLFKTHEFLRNSDYELRNIAILDGMTSFIYTANFYPSTCGIHLPGVDGGIVRVRTNLQVEPLVTGVE